MKQGVLIFDEKSGRFDIRFGLTNYYGGLHCGECFDVLVETEWVPTRIEMNVGEPSGWYLIGIKTKLPGLQVRINS